MGKQSIENMRSSIDREETESIENLPSFMDLGSESKSPGNGETSKNSSYSYGSVGGVTYSWENLNVYAHKKDLLGRKKDDVHILKNVSGLCKSGQLLAIMGASGAGKTTLLNVLTYRSVDLKIEGDIRINGTIADPNTLMGASAYVQQLDLFTRVFTVREQLTFHAQLRIGKHVSESERKTRVERVIQELGMMKCADTLIGEPGRIKGISGGEKKRLAFACELITNPLLLLCDEPTSGIDSFMAQNVMKAMKGMTHRGKTVISTIHQPSSEVFAMFDRLLILSEGRVAFLGTVDEAHNFFNRIDRPCPDDFNPGDHFIYTLAVRPGTEEEDRIYSHSICDKFRDTDKKRLDRQLQEARIPPETNALSNIQISKSPYRATYANQFAAVFRRSVLEVVREPTTTFIKVGQSLFFAIIFGLIYLNQDPATVEGAQNIASAMFIFITNLSFSSLFPVITVFAGELPLFLREHWNGLYRPDVYFITRNLVELPVYLIIPVCFNAISYYMVGFRPDANFFFISTGIMVLVVTVSVSYGYMISCMADDYNKALVISTPLTFPLMLFGGYYMQSDTIPVWLGWMQYLSWFMYGFEALSINQWENMSVFYNETYPDFPIGQEMLDRLSFETDDFGFDIWMIFALAVVYRLIAYLLLFLKTVRKK